MTFIKKRILLLISGSILALCLSLISSGIALAAPALFSETAVVMEFETSQVLTDVNKDQRMYPASITKIMTAALTLENIDLDDKVIITDTMLEGIDYSVTCIAMTPGEEFTAEQLLYTMMIESANDCANALAEYVAGSVYSFVDMMNKKAAELGCKNTHFANANGLHNENHYSTAYDMALITRYAMEIDGFREVFGLQEYSIPPTNIQPESRNFGTHHCMFVESSFTYEGTIGGKLGYTDQAGHTCVTAVERNDMTLICVTMNSSGKYSKFKDAIALFDDVFSKYHRIDVSSSEINKDTVIIGKDGSRRTVSFTLEDNYPVFVTDEVSHPELVIDAENDSITESGITAVLSARVDGKTVWSRSIPASAEIPENNSRSDFAEDYSVDRNRKNEVGNIGSKEIKTFYKVLICFFGVLLFLFLAVIIIRTYNIRRYRRIRENKYKGDGRK